MHCCRYTLASFHTVRNYVIYHYQQSLSRCIICHDICVQQQAATCSKTPTIVILSEPCYCCAIETNSRRIRSQVQPRNGAEISELLAHYCMTPGPQTLLFCRVSVLPINTLPLQELTNYSKLSCWFHLFQKILVLRPNFQGSKCLFFPPADAHDCRAIIILFQNVLCL